MVQGIGRSIRNVLPPRGWLVVALLWLVALLNYLDRLMITTMRDPIKDAIPMTDTQFGLLTSVFLWVYGALSPFGGFLADRFGRTRVIIGSLLIWSIVTWLTGHAKSFEQLLLARMAMGISEACYIPAALALIADYHRGSTRSLATGLHMSGSYAGAALGGMGGYVAEHESWRTGFTIFGSVGVAYAVVLLLSLRDASHRAEQTEAKNDSSSAALGAFNFGKVISGLFLTPGFYMLLLLNALVGAANWVISGWLPTYLKEHFDLSLGEAGLSATGYIQFAAFAGVICGGWWADRWSRVNPNARARVSAIGFCVAGPCLFLSAASGTLPLALAGFMMYSVARGFFDANNMPMLRQLVDERYSATGYGFLNVVSCAAGGILIYAGGKLKDAQMDLNLVFRFAAAGVLVAGLLLFVLKLRKTPTSGDPAASSQTNLNLAPNRGAPQ